MATSTPTGLQSSSMSWVGAGLSIASSIAGISAANAQAESAVETAKIRDGIVLRSAFRTLERLNVERASSYTQISAALASTRADEQKATGTTKAVLSAYGNMGGTATAILADNAAKADQAISTIKQNKDVLDQQLAWKVQDTVDSAKSQFMSGTYHGPTQSQIGMQYLLGTSSAILHNYKGDLFKDATDEFNLRFGSTPGQAANPGDFGTPSIDVSGLA